MLFNHFSVIPFIYLLNISHIEVYSEPIFQCLFKNNNIDDIIFFCMLACRYFLAEVGGNQIHLQGEKEGKKEKIISSNII